MPASTQEDDYAKDGKSLKVNSHIPENTGRFFFLKEIILYETRSYLILESLQNFSC